MRARCRFHCMVWGVFSVLPGCVFVLLYYHYDKALGLLWQCSSDGDRVVSVGVKADVLGVVFCVCFGEGSSGTVNCLMSALLPSNAECVCGLPDRRGGLVYPRTSSVGECARVYLVCLGFARVERNCVSACCMMTCSLRLAPQ